MGDAVRALQEFKQKHAEVLAEQQARFGKSFNNFIELLDALKPATKDTPIRFFVDLNWGSKNCPKGYIMNPNNILKFEEYQQMLTQLKQLDVISVADAGVDECPILQTLVENEPQTKQEWQLLNYVQHFPRVSDFLLFVKKAKNTSRIAQKLVIDISGLRNEQPTIVYLLMATNIEQFALGELGSGLANIRMNEIKRYEE